MNRMEKIIQGLGALGGITALLTSLYSMLGLNNNLTTAIAVTGVAMVAMALLFGVFYKVYKGRKWRAHIRATFVLSDVPKTRPKTWRVKRCFSAVLLVYLVIMYFVSIAAALDGNQSAFTVTLMLWIVPSTGYMYGLMGLTGREEFRRLRFWWRRRKVQKGAMWVK